MKKTLSLLVILTGLILCITHLNTQAQIMVQITPPSDTMGVCRENLFMAEFTASGLHTIRIQALVMNNQNPANFTCGQTTLAPGVIIQINNDSTTTAISNIVVDTAAGTWTGTFNDTGFVRLAYHIYIDCTVIPSVSNLPSLNLIQVWDDPANNDTYVLNSGNDTLVTPPLMYPFLVDVSPDFYFGSYLNVIRERFMYMNTGNIPANLQFRFQPDSTEYCGQTPHLGLTYSVGSSATPQPLTPNNLFPALLLPSDTLIIYQEALDSSCIDTTCSALVQLFWQCPYSGISQGAFCDHCQNTPPTDVQLRNTYPDTIRVERVLPVNARYDITCFNDTSSMMQWEYRLTNPGNGALDSVFIDLLGEDNAHFLTLIPAHTLDFDLNCVQCTVDSTIALRTNALCSGFVNNPLLTANYRIKNFQQGDTVIIRFMTFRCIEENNALLLNQGKIYNHWNLQVNARHICGGSAVRQNIAVAEFYFSANSGISSNSFNTGPDIDQQLIFSPDVTDLSVAPGATFGNKALMAVELKSLALSPGAPYFDYQLLGYNGGTFNANGIIRAHVRCEQGLRLENPAQNARLSLPTDTGSFTYINPIFSHTQVPHDECQAGDYFYYFDITGNQAITYWRLGNFEFELQACCPKDTMAGIPYEVTFHLMPNPNNCFSMDFSDTTHLVAPICSGLGCEWLPLSSTGNEIQVHCPGCKAPGVIVNHYKMQRTTFGLQDTDNDGRADSAFIAISDTSKWFKDRILSLRPRYSSMGDQLVDYMAAHFQDGDSTDGGYAYQQMVDLGVRLPYLQLSRRIPAGLDTMKLSVTALTLYIDTPDVSMPNCIDCEVYLADTAKWRTQHIIHVTQNSLAQFLDTLVQSNHLLFTFSSIDSAGAFSGNLHDTTFVVYSDGTSPFNNFFTGQGYRLKVHYDVCGNFLPPASGNYTIDLVRKQSTIENKMSLSGAGHSIAAYPGIPPMPNDLTDLNSKGWTLDPGNTDTTLTLINDTFASSFVFFCETFSGLHYFFTQDGRNESEINMSEGCTRFIDVKAASRTGGFTPVNVYPFEYRPPSFWPSDYTITVPQGYHITQTRVRNELVATGQNRTTNWRTFPPPQTTDTFSFHDSLLPPPVCLPQSVSFPINAVDTNLYAGSRYTRRHIRFYIEPDSCATNLIMPDDSTAIILFDKGTYPCVPVNNCPPDTTFERLMVVGNNPQPIVINPQLVVQVTPDSFEVSVSQVCTQINIHNQNTSGTTAAGYVFIALPDSLSVPYLSNWTFITGGDTLFPTGGQIIPLDTSLAVNHSMNGLLCAQYNSCQGSAQIDFHVGWNCHDFPSSPFHVDSVCSANTYSFQFTDAQVQVGTISKTDPDFYSLCDTFAISAPFTSHEKGNIYPQGFLIEPLPQGLQVISVVISNCSTGVTDTLAPDTLLQNFYPVTLQHMQQVGISDGAMSLSECIRCEVTLLPECAFAGTGDLPDIVFDWISFCGVNDTTPANFDGTFTWDGTSQCSDCFTIEKTALQDSVFVGDTATFQIVVCGNNDSIYSVLFDDFLPQDFTLTSSLPTFVNVPAIGCDTLWVSGYYSTPGTCNDSTYINTAQIITSQYDTIIDTACITVLDSCMAFSNVIIPDSAFATTYGSGFSNTTLYISGVFFIDTTFNLTNCTTYTSSSAQIIVLPTQQLILDSASVILGCSSMWPGITLDTTAKIVMMNQSQLQDAHYGIFAGFNSTVNVENSNIYDCVTGIYTPPASGFMNTQVNVRGSKIGLNASGFKVDYSGQPAHGAIPKAGIEINNIVMTLGGSGQRNEFFKMNTGIVANNSNLVVKNTEFYNIGYDTNYSELFRGTAMVGIVEEGFTGKLTVVAEPTAYYAVHDCHRAIYTDRAVLSANYVHLVDVYSGIYSTGTPHHQTSHVTGCTIITQTYGIFWINNRSAKFMIANNNNITVNGSSNTAARGFSKTAIYMSESMQQPVVFMATGNEISLSNAHNGIYSGNQTNAKIKFNNIRMNNSSTGIGINNNNRSSVSCNNITGDYGTSTIQSIGILTGNSSDRTALHCNTTDSTYRGFYFGGINPNTVMKGNDMKHHLNGLYLTSMNTYIGPQPHHGNRWLGPFNSFGGVNMALPLLVQLSKFDVDSTLGVTYAPLVNPTNWFSNVMDTSNSTFYCNSSTVCELPPPSLSQNEINELIASGTLLSESYAEETRAIAEEYLYRELMEDSTLRYSDSLFIEFMFENQGEPVAYLYDAEEYLRAATSFDSVFMALIDSAYSQLDAINDTLMMIDDGLEFYGSGYDYGALREQLLYDLEFLNQTISNLYSQQEASLNGNLAEAEIRNDLVVPETVPEENSSILNDTEIEFLESGGNSVVILSRYNQLLSIAHQCPYTGGPAVERARAFITMINDSMEYNDDAVCLQVGVYRNETETEVLNASYSGKQVEIIPNPATNQFEIILKTKHKGICHVTVHDSRKKLIMNHNFYCSAKSLIIESVNWSPGIYFISMVIDGSFIETQKLVIVK